MKVQSTHSGIQNRLLPNPIFFDKKIVVIDPYSYESCPDDIHILTNIMSGEWIAEVAFFVHAVDREIQDEKIFTLQVVERFLNAQLDVEPIKKISTRWGGPKHFFGDFNISSKDIIANVSGSVEFIKMINEVVSGYSPAYQRSIEQFKHNVLCNAAAKLINTNLESPELQTTLSELIRERDNPQYSKVQYIHLRHKEYEAFTSHDDLSWSPEGSFDNSSGKMAVFNHDWLFTNENEIIKTADQLCVEYLQCESSRNPVNLKKVGSDLMGLASTTPDREDQVEIFTKSHNGVITELLFHFDIFNDDF